jgi:hypothetical protein
MPRYNYIRVKQNWRLISSLFVIPFTLILSYSTLCPDTFIVLIIALLCFVHHDGITNCGGNLETCQDDIIVLFIMNVVFISYIKTMLICAIVQMTILDLVALNCIPWHSAAFEVTRLDSKAFNSIPTYSAPFPRTQLRLGQTKHGGPI